MSKRTLIVFLVAGAAIGWGMSGLWGLAMGLLLGWGISHLANALSDAAFAQAGHRERGLHRDPAPHESVRTHSTNYRAADRPSAGRRLAGQASAQRGWHSQPPEEQLAIAAERERDGELQMARQIYWHLVGVQHPHPAPYERLAQMYEEEGNDPQLIHVLDRGIEALQNPAADAPTSDRLPPFDLEEILSSFKRRLQAAIHRNNARYEM